MYSLPDRLTLLAVKAELDGDEYDCAPALREAAKHIREQESLLATRNEANAAAFTASDAYQKRCEQGDALLREARPYLDSFAQLTKHPTAGDDALAYKARIDAHLAGEDMGRGL
jgi:hypothetical protein